ncbi:unknown [Singapore grouper iridovirus]|uniref:Hemagglutinin n=1 Tax=Singapore grouper iridovirus TaxID=262968 RepID=Q5YFN6_9VIRU|nr:hypothetical protein ORF029L [Singapore grouper iridovirus]AAS18044.1 unknown [Singapore grouper iridovirus]WAU86738.1 hypothetical protein ORF029L [Singapore grouper iridovirus]
MFGIATLIACVAFTLVDCEHATCYVGNSCKLQCRVDSTKEALFHWYKKSGDSMLSVYSYYHWAPKLEFQSPLFKNRVSVDAAAAKSADASITIANISKADEGAYKCYTSHQTGNSEKILTVSVKQPIKHVSVSKVNDTFQCAAMFNTEPGRVDWNTHVIEYVSDGSSKITVTADVPDTDEYSLTCTASSGLVTVTATVFGTSITSNSTERVNVSCGYDTNRYVRWHRDGIFVADNNGVLPEYENDTRVYDDGTLELSGENKGGLYTCADSAETYMYVTRVIVDDRRPRNRAIPAVILILLVLAIAGFATYRVRSKLPKLPKLPKLNELCNAV